MTTPTPQQLCDSYAHRVYRFASMVTHDANDAEDLAHETLLKAITKLHRFDPGRGTIEAWLWRIVVNTARDAGRVARRQQTLIQRVSGLRETHEQVEDTIANHFRDDDLLAAVRHLRPRERAVIALRFGADLDYAQMGTTLGMSTAAVGVATRRALAQLKQLLEDTTHE